MSAPLPPVHPRRWSGCVLSGGQSSRMGGSDKGLTPLGGKPLAAWVLERLSPQVKEIAISANRHLDGYRALGVPVLPDVIGSYLGPLAGMHAALAALGPRCEAVAFVPCDGPLLPLDLVARLGAALAHNRGAYVTVDHRPEPTFCLVKSQETLALAQYIEAGGRRIQDYFAAIDAVAVPFDDAPECFTNLNTPSEWASFKAARDRLT